MVASSIPRSADIPVAVSGDGAGFDGPKVSGPCALKTVTIFPLHPALAREPAAAWPGCGVRRGQVLSLQGPDSWSAQPVDIVDPQLLARHRLQFLAFLGKTQPQRLPGRGIE